MLEIKSPRDDSDDSGRQNQNLDGYDPLKRNFVRCRSEPRASNIFSARCCISAFALTTSDIGRFLLVSYFFVRETRSEHAEAGAAACVSLGKTRLPFLRRKNVGIIYDLASGGTYTRVGMDRESSEERIWVNTCPYLG